MTDGVNVSLETIYAQQQEMMRTLNGIPQMVADHEARLRVQEKREDLAHRVSVLERASQGVTESVARIETELDAVQKSIADLQPVKVHPSTYWIAACSLIVAGAAVLVTWLHP